jgi:hypothetical protein
MRQYLISLLFTLSFFINARICYCQAIPNEDSILQSLLNRGATLSSSKFESLTPATGADLIAGKLVVDLFDTFLLNESLQTLEFVKAEKSILIGNSLANLQLADFSRNLSKCKNVKTVVLDSVDFDLATLNSLQAKMPTTEFVLSERTAIKCINDSYRFALEGKNVSAFYLVQNRARNNLHFEKEHFEPAIYFVGREVLEGGWRTETISRDAVRFFRHLRSLEKVCLSGIPIGDEDLSFLGSATKLTYLNLDESLVKGFGLGYLKSKKIRTLVLTNIPPLEIIPFHNFPELETLLVSQSGISIEALREISKCKKLAKLEMAGIKFDARNLELLLRENAALKQVYLGEEDFIPKKGEQTIQEVLAKFPDKKIVKTPPGYSRQEHGWFKKR